VLFSIVRNLLGDELCKLKNGLAYIVYFKKWHGMES